MTSSDSGRPVEGSGAFLSTVFMCFDWRVLAGFAVLDLGLLTASPHLALDALPVELVLLCPITAAKMVWRMNAQRRMRQEHARPAAVRPAP